MKEILVLLRAEVAVDGSLHLDAAKTKILLRWLTAVGQTLDGYERVGLDLMKLLKIEMPKFNPNMGDILGLGDE